MRRWLGENRIYLLFVVVLAGMGATTDGFMTWPNMALIMNGVSINALLATGFAVVLITRQLDLSIGATLTLGAMLTAGLYPKLGWIGAAGVAMAAGLAIGLVNGLLVAKAKVDSFITTLGTMIIVTGLGLRYCGGGTIFAQDYAASAWLERPWLATGPGQVLTSPLVVIALGVVVLCELFLKRTVYGRNLYMVGGNPRTAFYSGLSTDNLWMGAFALSGVLSALGGALTAVRLNAAEPGIGSPSLMMVIAAVIVGGTSMQGGRGSAFKSLVALFTINMVAAGFNRRGAGSEVINIANGVMLGAIVLYEAFQTARQRLLRGRRHELMEQIEAEFDTRNVEDDVEIQTNEPNVEGDTVVQKKENSLAAVCVTAMACVAMVAMMMMFLSRQQPVPQIITTTTAPGVAVPTAKPSAPVVDITQLKSTDRQPLLPKPEPEIVPPRPPSPESLPETDAGHWYDQEYAVWGVERAPMSASPGDGPRGKHVVHLKFIDHPYLTAMSNGMKKVADAYGIRLTTMCADNDTNKQKTQVDQVVTMKPDFVIINAVSPKASVPLLRKLYDAGIPVIASNQLISREALQYTLSWTGPDDWGQFRMLAREFAKLMNHEGGYVIIRHFPGNSCYDSRTWGAVTELRKIAPNMKLLDMQTTNLEMIETEKVVAGWLTRHGKLLKGIISADDSGAQLGINKACENAGRNDVIRVAAGHSKVGMEAIQAGQLHAITYQSAEADGAIPLYLAAEWFSGKKIPEVQYLPKRIITAENVADYLPPQW